MAKQISLERNWCSELVSLIRVRHNGFTESIPGNLEEIGERMAMVLTESAVPLGSRVHIVCKSNVLRGVAKSCRFDQALGYLIEVRLVPASFWSPDWFVPEHLVRFPTTGQHNQLRLSA